MSTDPLSASITYPLPRRPRVRFRDEDGESLNHSNERPRQRYKADTLDSIGSGLNELLNARGPSGTLWAHRYRPKPTSESPGLCIDLYRLALDSSETFVYAIDPRTWVAEIYDPITHEKGRGVDSWVILQGTYDEQAGSMRFSCSKWCPDKQHYHSDCLHELLLNGSDRPNRLPGSNHDNPTATIFRWTPTIDTEPSLLLYCVMSATREPTIVSYNGFCRDSGVWSCRRCRDMLKCVHIDAAIADGSHLHLLPDSSEIDAMTAVQGHESVEERRAEILDKANRNSQRSLHDERSISYLPVGAPRWCRLESDPESAPTISRHEIKYSDAIPLGCDPRCRCGSSPDLTAPRRVIECTIFDVTRAHSVTIEVQRCSSCPREHNMDAGPDLRDLGLFNLNNSRVFSHALLNDYTNSMTSLEAPFHSFCDIVRKRYRETSYELDFVGEDSFRTAWFSFTRIQQIYGSMHCDICGDHPDCIIFDGQTGGFAAEHTTSTLCPPTNITLDSPRRLGANKAGRQTSAIPTAIGKRARLAVRWRMSLTRSGSSPTTGIHVDDTADVAADADANEARAQQQQRLRISKRDAYDAAMWAGLESIATELEAVLTELACMFRAVVMAPHNPQTEEVRQPYMEFLSQVFAHESILQFLPERAFIPVHWLLSDDPDAATALLTHAPALGVISRMELQLLHKFTPETKRIAAWLMERSAKVRAMLPKNTPSVPHIPASKSTVFRAENTGPTSITTTSSAETLVPETVSLTDTEAHSRSALGLAGDDPRETGSFYGRPRIRARPVYTNLPGDCATDRAVVTEEAKATGIGCSKFYETYGIGGLTGGIMAAWCPHLICLGFHVIPRGEGRNDVFSALYCFWEVAPRYVIYDFACALAPYCMAREPKFFEDTVFLIDSFHSKGHTRCSKACMLSYYQLHNPSLRTINSSAAECGNAGLRKIRKPLSYMSQRHAIVYTMSFFAVWNRGRRIDALRHDDRVRRIQRHRHR